MYRSLFFTQGDQAIALLDLLDQHGARALIEYMIDHSLLDFDNVEMSDKCPAGTSDLIDQWERYTVVYNPRLCYIGIEFFHFSKELVA